jgi:hypothetical protein
VIRDTGTANPRVRRERDTQIERTVARLTAMMTHCTSSANSQTAGISDGGSLDRLEPATACYG